LWETLKQRGDIVKVISYSVLHCVSKAFLKKFEIFFLLQINMFLMFSNHFDVLTSKMIFKKIKKILLAYFSK
jgi:hypothetical protein